MHYLENCYKDKFKTLKLKSLILLRKEHTAGFGFFNLGRRARDDAIGAAQKDLFGIIELL